MSDLFPLIFGLVFVLILGSILFQAAKGVAEWSHNNSMPIVSKRARVIAKRINTKIHRHNHNHHHSTSSSNSYYLTFEDLDSRERMVFKVKSRDFDLVVENDTGELTHQGTRFHSFGLY